MMNARPSPRTPYELKLRLEAEQAFYDAHAQGLPGAGVRTLANGLADRLDSLSRLLRQLAPVDDHRHAA